MKILVVFAVVLLLVCFVLVFLVCRCHFVHAKIRVISACNKKQDDCQPVGYDQVDVFFVASGSKKPVSHVPWDPNDSELEQMCLAFASFTGNVIELKSGRR